MNNFLRSQALLVIFLCAFSFISCNSDDDDSSDGSSITGDGGNKATIKDYTGKTIDEDIAVSDSNITIKGGDFSDHVITLKAYGAVLDGVKNAKVVIDAKEEKGSARASRARGGEGGAASKSTISITIKDSAINTLEVSQNSADVEIALSSTSDTNKTTITAIDIKSPNNISVVESNTSKAASDITSVSVSDSAPNVVLGNVKIETLNVESKFISLGAVTVGALTAAPGSNIALTSSEAEVTSLNIKEGSEGTVNIITDENVSKSDVIKSESIDNVAKDLRYIPYQYDEESGQYTFTYIPWISTVTIGEGEDVYLVSNGTGTNNGGDWLTNKEKNKMEKGDDGIYRLSTSDTRTLDDIIGNWYGYNFYIGDNESDKWAGYYQLKDEYKYALPAGYALTLPNYDYYVKEKYVYMPYDKPGDFYTFNFSSDFYELGDLSLTSDTKAYILCKANDWRESDKWELKRTPSGIYGAVIEGELMNAFTGAGSDGYTFLFKAGGKVFGYNDLKSEWKTSQKFYDNRAQLLGENRKFVVLDAVTKNIEALDESVMPYRITAGDNGGKKITFVFNPDLYWNFKDAALTAGDGFKMCLLCKTDEKTSDGYDVWSNAPSGSKPYEMTQTGGVYEITFDIEMGAGEELKTGIKKILYGDGSFAFTMVWQGDEGEMNTWFSYNDLSREYKIYKSDYTSGEGDSKYFFVKEMK